VVEQRPPVSAGKRDWKPRTLAAKPGRHARLVEGEAPWRLDQLQRDGFELCRYVPSASVTGPLEQIQKLLGENRHAAAEQVAHKALAALDSKTNTEVKGSAFAEIRLSGRWALSLLTEGWSDEEKTALLAGDEEAKEALEDVLSRRIIEPTDEQENHMTADEPEVEADG
jgi:hypothetical protein